MSERFFSAAPIQSDRVLLTGPEAHHLLHVMRAKRGDRVVLFDGSGWEFEAELLRATTQEAQLLILQRTYVDRELPVVVVLAVAMPKGERQKWLVEKAVELGVGRFVPLVAARSVAQPGPAMRERLQRIVIEASKQCGRNILMQIAPPMSWTQWLSAYPTAQLRWIADPSGHLVWPEYLRSFQKWSGELALPSEPTLGLPTEQGRPSKPIWTVTVGPEGGWTHSERAEAQAAGWQLVSLGPRILRTETAAVAFASLLSAWASCQGGRPVGVG